MASVDTLPNRNITQEPLMTEKELALFDGREGRRAYVAVHGKIHDVTDSPYWQDGDHEKRHRAGCDLSKDLESAPHVRAVIERFPVVGVLAEEIPPAPAKGMKVLGAGIIALLLLMAVLFMLK